MWLSLLVAVLAISPEISLADADKYTYVTKYVEVPIDHFR